MPSNSPPLIYFSYMLITIFRKISRFVKLYFNYSSKIVFNCIIEGINDLCEIDEIGGSMNGNKQVWTVYFIRRAYWGGG